MMLLNMNQNNLLSPVQSAIKELYTKDIDLIKKDLCERCLVNRLAIYLDKLFPEFYVDCEFNKSFYKDIIGPKILSNINGNYVDIIVHKRSNNLGENLLCFEVKKKKNTRDRDKDRENLRILTDESRFSYAWGFYIILGNSYETTQIEIYSKGHLVQVLRQIVN